MRETSFIKNNKKKWKEFEEILEQQKKDPDKLNDLFIQITDDLSYSRTFYPNRSVRVYLNNLAQQIFHSIYKNKKSRRSRLMSFWTDELPHLIYNARQEFRLAFFLFVVAFIIGVVSSAMNPEFPRVILGDSYVDMTIENIESGDPMAVYKEKGAFGMSMGITINNLFVAFLIFILGVFYAIGTVFFLIKNAVMVGAFQYFFFEKGVFLESFLTIWIHGTFEISAIIIAAAAGLTMGKGLVFPETYSRLQAFQISARRGLKIMLGIIPLFLLAGFFEGYLTRHTEVPDIVRALFIMVCLSFVLYYYVWFPWKKSKTGFVSQIKESKLSPNKFQRIELQQIKSTVGIFSDIFTVYRKQFKWIALMSFVVATLFCLLNYSMTSETELEKLFIYPHILFGSVMSIEQFFVNSSLPFLPLVNIFLFSVFSVGIYHLFIKETTGSKIQNKLITFSLGFIKLAPVVALFQYIMAQDSNITFLISLIVFPVLFLWMYVMIKEETNIFMALSKTFSLYSGNYGRMLSLFFLLTCIAILAISITDTSLLSIYIEVICSNFLLEEEGMKILVNILLSFSSIFVLCLVFAMMMIGTALLYHSLLEIKEANYLKKRIQYIGIGKQIKGMDAEV